MTARLEATIPEAPASPAAAVARARRSLEQPRL
jgi:hypothetical protein